MNTLLVCYKLLVDNVEAEVCLECLLSQRVITTDDKSRVTSCQRNEQKMKVSHSVYSTLYTLLCIFYSVYSTLYTLLCIPCILYSVYSTLYTLYTLLCILYTIY